VQPDRRDSRIFWGYFHEPRTVGFVDEQIIREHSEDFVLAEEVEVLVPVQ